MGFYVFIVKIGNIKINILDRFTANTRVLGWWSQNTCSCGGRDQIELYRFSGNQSVGLNIIMYSNSHLMSVQFRLRRDNYKSCILFVINLYGRMLVHSIKAIHVSVFIIK